MHPAAVATIAAAAGLLLLAANRGAAAQLVGDAGSIVPTADGQAEQGQGGAALDVSAALATLDLSSTDLPVLDAAPPADAGDMNLAAFLMTIRAAEGCADPDGYRRMFGGSLFSDYADHPRMPHRFTDAAGRLLWSTAAGAYQLCAVSTLPDGSSTRVDTWDRLKSRLGLADFSPASQDAAAVQLIDDAGALADARAGRLAAAVAKCRRIWASLPGAGYDQPERSIAWLETKFAAAGGTVA